MSDMSDDRRKMVNEWLSKTTDATDKLRDTIKTLESLPRKVSNPSCDKETMIAMVRELVDLSEIIKQVGGEMYNLSVDLIVNKSHCF